MPPLLLQAQYKDGARTSAEEGMERIVKRETHVGWVYDETCIVCFSAAVREREYCSPCHRGSLDSMWRSYVYCHVCSATVVILQFRFPNLKKNNNAVAK